MDKDEDREKSIRRFCVTLYQNIAGRKTPFWAALEQNQLAKLQEEQAEYEAELPKDPLQRIREAILRDRPRDRRGRTERKDSSPLSNLIRESCWTTTTCPILNCCWMKAVEIDLDDIAARSTRGFRRVADLAEAHRDMCCREVELALDRCSTFSPSHDELRDFVGTLLERRAVVERNGQAWRDPVADKKMSLEKWRVTGGRQI